jgi:hypothetical protein
LIYWKKSKVLRSLGNKGIADNGVVLRGFWLPTYFQRTWRSHGPGVGVGVGVPGGGVLALANCKPRTVWTAGIVVGEAVGVGVKTGVGEAVGVAVGVGDAVGLGYAARFRLPR